MAAYRPVDDLATCRLTACTPGSALGPTLGVEYLKPLPLPLWKGTFGDNWQRYFHRPDALPSQLIVSEHWKKLKAPTPTGEKVFHWSHPLLIHLCTLNCVESAELNPNQPTTH